MRVCQSGSMTGESSNNHIGAPAWTTKTIFGGDWYRSSIPIAGSMELEDRQPMVCLSADVNCRWKMQKKMKLME